MGHKAIRLGEEMNRSFPAVDLMAISRISAQTKSQYGCCQCNTVSYM